MNLMVTIVRIAGSMYLVYFAFRRLMNLNIDITILWITTYIISYSYCVSAFLSFTRTYVQAKVVPVYSDEGAAKNRYIYSNGDIIRLPSGLTSRNLWFPVEPFKRWVLAS